MATTAAAAFPTNYHILEVTFVGHTETKPARIEIKSHRYGQSVNISANTDYSTKDAAIEWLRGEGFEIVGQGEKKSGYFLTSTTFKQLKK